VLKECLNCQLIQTKMERQELTHVSIYNTAASRSCFYLYHRNFSLILKTKKKEGEEEI